MATLWQSMIPEIMAASLAHDRWASRRQRTFDFVKAQNYYDGGDLAAQYLTQHPGEADDEFADRKKRFASLNITRRIVDEIAHSIYGGQVVVELPGATDKQVARLESVWTYNDMGTVRGVLANSIGVNGGAYANAAFIARDENILVHAVPPQNIDYEVDPDSPWRMAAIDEMRKELNANGAEDETHWMWVGPGYADGYPNGWGAKFTKSGGVIDDRFLANGNPYGQIPYVYWRGLPKAGIFEGLSFVRDVITMQQAIGDDLSDLRYTIGLQGYGIPFIDAPEPMVQENKKAIALSPGRIAWLGEKGRSLGFASPGAPITEVLGALEKTIEWACIVGLVPVELVRGSVAESGVALLLKMRPLISLAMAARNRAIYAETELVRLICAIAKAEKLGDFPDPALLVGDKAPRIRFIEDVIPIDSAAERTQDQIDVESGRMARTDYLVTWREGIDSEEEATQYLERIAAEESIGRPERSTQPFDAPLQGQPLPDLPDDEEIQP